MFAGAPVDYCVDWNGNEDGRGEFAAAAAAAVVFGKAAATGVVADAAAGLYEDWKMTRWEEVLRARSWKGAIVTQALVGRTE